MTVDRLEASWHQVHQPYRSSAVVAAPLAFGMSLGDGTASSSLSHSAFPSVGTAPWTLHCPLPLLLLLLLDRLLVPPPPRGIHRRPLLTVPPTCFSLSLGSPSNSQCRAVSCLFPPEMMQVSSSSSTDGRMERIHAFATASLSDSL